MTRSFSMTKGIPWRFGPDWPGQRCEAKTRKGTPCQRPAYRRNGRCSLHGGRSTGPKTEDGFVENDKGSWELQTAAREPSSAYQISCRCYCQNRINSYPQSTLETSGARAAIGGVRSELMTFCRLALGGPSRIAGLGPYFWQAFCGAEIPICD